MKLVKQIFFLTEDEAAEKRKETGNDYISHKLPHFTLDDGTIIWGKIGYPAATEVWFGPSMGVKVANE